MDKKNYLFGLRFRFRQKVLGKRDKGKTGVSGRPCCGKVVFRYQKNSGNIANYFLNAVETIIKNLSLNITEDPKKFFNTIQKRREVPFGSPQRRKCVL